MAATDAQERVGGLLVDAINLQAPIITQYGVTYYILGLHRDTGKDNGDYYII